MLLPKSQLVLLAACLLALIILATGLGYIRISPLDVLRILGARISGLESLLSRVKEVYPYVVWEVRLPRILTSAIVGCGLAASGAVFQGILLNPLADPYTLGVSAEAAFGASLALMLDVAFLGHYTVALMAFCGALGTLVAVLWLSSSHGQATTTNLILSGVIVAAILSAAIGLIKHLADEQVSVIIFWLMGSFVAKTWLETGLSLTFVLIGLAVAVFYARDLNIMSLGQRSADALGVDTKRVKLILLVTATLVTAICVSVSGIIGFVGLVVPHAVRFVLGSDNRLLLPATALSGAILLLGADTLTRVVLPHEVPIGVLTAIIGGPYFCYIFRKKQLSRGHA